MSFANWKNDSNLYKLYKDRVERYGTGYQDVCQAAYKAGERQGRKDAEEMAKRAIELRELIARAANINERKEA